ncbi:para-nitrobenzyl esterase [Kribbella amoyensis]|uniref:Carboxylic ester hydrolase n=1 Tax=Kribbella amoyensis TaxID=996641 RepID=A0A561BS33_9ACTN|nr:carboxylesterase family protein [Kribbella amoyensis]TWD81676.1 para-nitrobenzyl esterase [Kribbella amoyensis]
MQSSTAAAAAPEVRTDAGDLRGRTTDAGIRVFEGIPYAAPPIGTLRWSSPRPARPWSGVREATTPGSICPQLGRSDSGQPMVAGEEDCLSLNVWAPAQASKAPVLLFLHGGGFTGGVGSLYDPSELVARGNIVVTANYRLGALGFLKHAAMRDSAAGNFGILDQQEALRWIKRNVAAFGGDANRVTLWGESGGAFSVCAQLASPSARGLFARAIVQSGPCVNDMLPAKKAERRASSTAAELGCPDPRTAIDCLRAKPFEQLTGLAEDDKLDRRTTDRPWLPTVGTPVLPLQLSAAQRLGTATAVPVLQGGTKDEMRSFVGSGFDDAGRPVTAAQYLQIIQDLYGRDSSRVLAKYPAAKYPTPSLALAQVLTDEGRLVGACTQLVANGLMARRAPVYAFEFAEPRAIQPGQFPYGAHHGVEIPYFFDSTSTSPWQPPPLTPDQQALAVRLLDQWSAFAATGRPAANWAPYRRDVVRSFTAAATEPVNLRQEHQCDFWDSLGR